jgi:aminomethyltransferase
VIVSRTGYSGELGFELMVWPEHEPALWELIVKLGEAHEACPYGMETTMILGFEKGYLNKRDFYPGSTPLEVGLGWTVDLTKPDFVGKGAVLRRREEGIKTRLVGFDLPSKVPTPVYGDAVLLKGQPVGKITNAIFSPRLDLTLARGWLPVDMAVGNTEVEILTGGTLLRASVRPSHCWYDPQGLRLQA